MTTSANGSARDYLLFFIPLAVYLITCAPGIGFGDTAIIIDNIYNFKVNSQVNTHPLSLFVGQLFLMLPFESVAYKANLMSVVAGSLSVFLLYKALYLAFESRFVPLLVAGLFMVSKSMWWHSTTVENYAISSVLTGCALIAFVKLWKTQNGRWLKWLFFIVGIGLYNHVQLGFLGMGVGAAFLLHLRREESPFRFFIGCSFALVIGLLPWIVTVLQDYRASGDLAFTLKMAFVGVFENTFFSVSFLQGLQDTGFVYFLEYPHLFLPVPFTGVYFAARKMGWSSPAFWGIAIYLCANTVFFTYYNTWDRFAFLLQSFMLLTFFGAFAIAALVDYLERTGKRRWKSALVVVVVACMGWSAAFYSLMTQWGKDPQSIWYRNYNNNYSINLYEHSEFIINPNKSNYRELDIYAERLFTNLPENSIYIDDDSRTYYPIVEYFQKINNRRRDINVVLINSWSIEGWGSSPREVARVIERAHRENRPLFMASLQWPYNTIVEHLPDDVEFVKFEIGGGRWIYKLQVDDAAPLPVDFGSTVRSDYIDLQSRHYRAASDAFYTLQDMTSFAGTWRFADQVFVSFPEVDSQAEFFLTSDIDATLKLTLRLTRAPDFGSFEVRFNDQLIAENLSLYADQVEPYAYSVEQPVTVAQGGNVLRFIPHEDTAFTGRLKMGIDGIDIER